MSVFHGRVRVSIFGGLSHSIDMALVLSERLGIDANVLCIDSEKYSEGSTLSGWGEGISSVFSFELELLKDHGIDISGLE